MLPWIGWGDPVRTAGNEEQASSVARAGGWRTGRDQKSPLRRCFKPRPSWRTRCAGFASGCRSSVSELKRSDDLAIVAISLRAAVRPLVRMPTDRHTATGTCEIGQGSRNSFRNSAQGFCAPSTTFRTKKFGIRSRVFKRRLNRASIAGGEGRDPHAVAHEADHHGDAQQEEDDLQRVDAVIAEAQEVR